MVREDKGIVLFFFFFFFFFVFFLLLLPLLLPSLCRITPEALILLRLAARSCCFREGEEDDDGLDEWLCRIFHFFGFYYYEANSGKYYTIGAKYEQQRYLGFFQ